MRTYGARSCLPRCCWMLGPRGRPRGHTSDRTKACVLGLLGAAVLLLLSSRVSGAGEAVRCNQARRDGILRAHRHDLSGAAPRSTLRARRILTLPAILDRRRGRLDLFRAALVAPPGRLRRESDAAVRDRLSRMRDLAMVERFRKKGLLVRVPAEAKTYYVTGVSAPLRVVRPWTKSFIEQVSQAFHDLFDRRLRITSLTRTRAVQRRLLRAHIGAAPAQGPVQSTHLTGATIDMSKRSLSDRQIAWLRTVLALLNRKGLIHVAEEFQEPHFHVMVTRGYREHGRALRPPDPDGGC